MEAVLDLYSQSYNPQEPVVCFDGPVQLISETRIPLPPELGKPERYDYEYKREGTCNLLAFFQPLIGWRQIKVTQHRTSEDLALCMQYLVDVLCPDATLIHIVLDHLNAHTPAALYQTFPPQEALRILSQIQFHYTPKHGSWLNLVELEFSVLSKSMSRPTDSNNPRTATGSGGMGARTQSKTNPCQLALFCRRCTHNIQASLSNS